MRRLVTCVLFLTAFTATAHAATLEITGGGYSFDESNPFFDACGTITGSGAVISGCRNNAFNPQSLTTGETFLIINASLVLDGRLYPPTPPDMFGDSLNLRMHFVYAPVPQSALERRGNPPVLPGDTVSEPFTMTGTLTVIDTNTGSPVLFDLLGQGILDVWWRNDPMSSFPFLHIDFRFTPVPEPSSLLLVTLGAVGVVCGRAIGRKLRAPQVGSTNGS